MVTMTNAYCRPSCGLIIHQNHREKSPCWFLFSRFTTSTQDGYVCAGPPCLFHPAAHRGALWKESATCKQLNMWVEYIHMSALFHALSLFYTETSHQSRIRAAAEHPSLRGTTHFIQNPAKEQYYCWLCDFYTPSRHRWRDYSFYSISF